MKLAKYNGCGNDFVILMAQDGLDYSALAQQLCNEPRFDTDGLIAVATEPFEMIFYNRDGSRAPMCGNGIRCFAKYVWDNQLTTEKQFTVKTLAGPMKVTITSVEPFTCQVAMGAPKFEPALIGVPEQTNLPDYSLELADGSEVNVASVFLSTVHTVVFVADALAELEQSHGEMICHHPFFKGKTNVNFVQVINQEELIVRTYERGVGWTLACGTGCCASYVIARDKGLIKAGPTQIHLATGTLTISGEETIIMNGPAEEEEELIC